MIRKIVAVGVAVAVAVLLSGCAAYQEGKKSAQCDQWWNQNMRDATSESDFYRREVARNHACSPPAFALISAKLVVAAQRLEAGRITRDQFELYKAQLFAEQQREFDANMRAMMPIPVLILD
jgi:hypothetical protein